MMLLSIAIRYFTDERSTYRVHTQRLDVMVMVMIMIMLLLLQLYRLVVTFTVTLSPSCLPT